MRTADPGPRRVGEMSRRGAPATRAPPGPDPAPRGPARGLGATVLRVRTEPLSAARWEPRFRGAVSRQTTALARCAGFLLASAAHAPAPAPFVAGTCPGAFGAQPGACERVPRARLSGAGRSRAAAWPSGLSHTRARAPAPGRCSYLRVDSVCWAGALDS